MRSKKKLLKKIYSFIKISEVEVGIAVVALLLAAVEINFFQVAPEVHYKWDVIKVTEKKDISLELLIASRSRLCWDDVMELADEIRFNSMVYEEQGMTPTIILSVIDCESVFKANAVSSSNAYGLMQITENVFKYHMGVGDLFSIRRNVSVGTKELVRLKGLLDTWDSVFTGYNCGYYGYLQLKKFGLDKSHSYYKKVNSKINFYSDFFD